MICENSLSPQGKLDVYLAQVATLVPILVVDSVILNAISSDKELLFADRVKVAVEKRFEDQRIALHEEMLEIIYFEQSNDLDYWIFTEADGTKRAMLPFNVTMINTWSYPTKINHFLQDWSYSRMITCADVLKRPANISRRIPLSFARHLADLRDFIKTHDNAHLIFHDGTLLGWYRECSIIPHTTDVDFFIRSEEFSSKILDALKDPESPYRLYRIYGMINDSYELTVTVKHASPRVKIDIFSMYTTKEKSWTGGLVWKSRQKYKWTYPRLTEFCSGDLLGHLIYVPCNVEGVLKGEYGDWTKEKPSSRYVWYKSARNVSPNGKFTKMQMKTMKKNK